MHSSETSPERSLQPLRDPPYSPRTPPRTPSATAVDPDLTPRGRPLPPASRTQLTDEDSEAQFDVFTSRLGSTSTTRRQTSPRSARLVSLDHGLAALNVRTLHDLLQAKPPPTPAVYKRGAMTSTKHITKSEVGLGERLPLRRIVFLPRLVDQLFPIAQDMLDHFRIRLDDPVHSRFITHVLPEIPISLLPRKVFTERDIASWCDSTIFRPALAALRAVMIGRIALEENPIYPYLSSSPTSTITPDAQLVCKGDQTSDETESVVKLIIEHKSQSIANAIFADLFKKPDDFPEGRAVRFQWPTTGDMASCDPRTRVIVQVCVYMLHFLLSKHSLLRFGRNCSKRDVAKVCYRPPRQRSFWHVVKVPPTIQCLCHRLTEGNTVLFWRHSVGLPWRRD